MIEEEPDLAYLNLVSAIEVLCNETKIEGAKIDDLDQDLKPLIESIEDKTLGGKIAETILRRSFMKRKFVKFILDNIEEDFWSPKDRPEIFQIKREDLEDYLKRIYNQRSRTLHDGKPFPLQYIFLQ